MKPRQLISYFITGALISLAFPPFNIFPMLFVAFAIMILITNASVSMKEVFLKTYLIYFSFEIISISWIALSGLRESADRFMIVGGLLTILLHSILLTVPFLIYYIIRKNILYKYKSVRAEIYTLFTFPIIYTTIEFLYEQPQLSFPWVTLGNALSSAIHKIQFAEITGVYGISLWVLILSCIIVLIFNDLKGSNKKRLILISIFILIFFLPDFYTVATGSKNKYTDFKKYGEKTIGIIQPNINPWHKWGAKQIDLVNNYVSLINQLDTVKKKNDMIVLPETAMPFYLLEDYYNDKYELIKKAIDSLNTPLLVGTPDLVFYNDSVKAKPDSKENKSSGAKYDTFNSAVLINPGESKISHQKYNKIKLVVASERMPYQEKLSFLKNIIRWSVGISSFQIGWDTTVFKSTGFEFNTAICYESIYPEFYSRFINKGSEFTVIITNDGWWGKLFGTYQHNQFATLRAIENRRWIARCANTGISCFIDPYGNMYQQTEINEPAYISRTIGLNKEKTFYTQNPYLLPDAFLMITGFIIIFSIAVRYKK